MVWKSTDWHQQFCCRQITQRLQLPFILSLCLMPPPMTDLRCAVLEKRVRDLMGKRVAQASGRSTGIKLDSETRLADGHGTSILHFIAGDYLDMERISQPYRIKGRSRPAKIERTAHESSRPMSDNVNRFPLLQ
jgi:hypothetical protein